MSETTSSTEDHAAMAAITTGALKVADRLDVRVISVWTRGFSEFSVSVQFSGTDTATVDRYADELGLTTREESTNYYRSGKATLSGHTVHVQAYCGHPNPAKEAE